MAEDHGIKWPREIRNYHPILNDALRLAKKVMSGYDGSHDYLHVLRVLSNAMHIFYEERKRYPGHGWKLHLVCLGAILHDLCDHKYNTDDKNKEALVELLDKWHYPHGLRWMIWAIVNNVAYSKEVENPEQVQRLLGPVPELGIVQDADRLDALGAIGVARCFTYGGAKRPQEPLTTSLRHFEEKLFKLAGMMKTETGRQMAQGRMALMLQYHREFHMEQHISLEFDLSVDITREEDTVGRPAFRSTTPSTPQNEDSKAELDTLGTTS